MSSYLSGPEQAMNWLCAWSRQVFPKLRVGGDVRWGHTAEEGTGKKYTQMGTHKWALPTRCTCRPNALAPSYLPPHLRTRTARVVWECTDFKRRRNSMVSFIFTPWYRQNAPHPSDRRGWYWRLDTEASYTTGHM